MMATTLCPEEYRHRYTKVDYAQCDCCGKWRHPDDLTADDDLPGMFHDCRVVCLGCIDTHQPCAWCEARVPDGDEWAMTADKTPLCSANCEAEYSASAAGGAADYAFLSGRGYR